MKWNKKNLNGYFEQELRKRLLPLIVVYEFHSVSGFSFEIKKV
jgi:hypothetical protein